MIAMENLRKVCDVPKQEAVILNNERDEFGAQMDELPAGRAGRDEFYDLDDDKDNPAELCEGMRMHFSTLRHCCRTEPCKPTWSLALVPFAAGPGARSLPVLLVTPLFLT
mmetsp:Transcript_180821/g.573923  ORF Transcript_180821/g.573923 Transcript_180821/m.573923 type:complete len:110 (+) Transcript_180821:85-414(+)